MKGTGHMEWMQQTMTDATFHMHHKHLNYKFW
jgi:hypothetical protein